MATLRYEPEIAVPGLGPDATRTAIRDPHKNSRTIPCRRANAQLSDQCTRRHVGSFQSTPPAGTEPRPASPGPCPARFQALATLRARRPVSAPTRLVSRLPPPAVGSHSAPRRPSRSSSAGSPFAFRPSLPLLAQPSTGSEIPSLGPDGAPARPGPVPAGFEPSPSPSGRPARISRRAPRVFRPRSRVPIACPRSGFRLRIRMGPAPPFMSGTM